MYSLIYIFATITFTVYGQLMLKLRLAHYHEMPSSLLPKFVFLTKVILTDPLVFSSFASAFVASLFWMTAIKNMNLSVAYPFMSLSFVLVICLSSLIFHEKMTIYQVVGMLFIIAGVSLIGLHVK